MITSISFAVSNGNNYYAEIGTMSLDATSNAYTDLEELEAITKNDHIIEEKYSID